MELKEVVQREIRRGGAAGEERRKFVLRRGVGARSAAAIRSRRICMTPRKRARCRKTRCWLRWAAAIRRRWRSCSAGETVLDLGSGGGIDVLLSARRVGPSGKAYGLDMTDEMLALARDNQREAGVENVEFLKGEIEHIPLPDNSVDVVISNCVINLSGDKDRVLREAFRVLKPGGRLAVSDVVTRGEVPESVRQEHAVVGRMHRGRAARNTIMPRSWRRAGFEDIGIEPTRVYDIEDARAFLSGQGVDVDAIAPQVEGKFMSAFIRATKPAGCCAPGCCS